MSNSKKVVVLRGAAGRGKTTTLKKLCCRIMEKYPNHEKRGCNKKGDNDITVFIIIDDEKIGIKKIGIESAGDVESRIEKSLECFIEKNCSIIFCAARTHGGTVNCIKKCIKKHGDEYKYTSLRKDRKRLAEGERENANSEMAEKLLSMGGL